ncbi:MAG: hypothetical protein INR71_03830, partial [Terriglobus roseus]|nr:hypothetical protein [Terriglobus roseus]
MPLMRIPYTEPLPEPRIIPASAASAAGAVEALARFLAPPLTQHSRRQGGGGGGG